MSIVPSHRFHATPLLTCEAIMQNVATLSLESPYYGARKPPAQRGSKLQRVSDLLILGRATIEESLFLLAWAQREGFARLGANSRKPSCWLLFWRHAEFVRVCPPGRKAVQASRWLLCCRHLGLCRGLNAKYIGREWPARAGLHGL